MKTTLDHSLESIDPVSTLDQLSGRVDEALNSSRVKSGIIEQLKSPGPFCQDSTVTWKTSS